MKVSPKMKVHYSSQSQEWGTPQALFDDLYKEFGFTVDVAASETNHKLPKYLTKDSSPDGLESSWAGERVFCNPPYGKQIKHWVKRLADGQAEIAVGLLPARTDTAWFHDHILGKAEIRFIRGRVKFGNEQTKTNPQPAPFPSMICIWRNK